MDQVLFGRRVQNTTTTATRYNSITGGVGWGVTESAFHRVCPSAGTIKNLRVVLETAPGAGTSWVFTLMVDGVASALVATIEDTNTSGVNTSSTISVSAGQTLSMRAVPSGTPTAPQIGFTTVFTGTTTNESVVMGHSNALGLNSAANGFWPLSVGPGFADPANELAAQQLCAGAGTIRNLYVVLDADPGTSPDAYRFTLRLNGSSQTLTVTITADGTTGNDTSNSFTVAAGDLLTLLVEPLNGPAVAPNAAWGVTFVADTDGESLVMSGSQDDVHTINTEHYNLQFVNDTSWGVGETSNRNAFDTCVLRNLYVDLENAPGAGNSYVFSLRISSDEPPVTYVDGNLSVTVSGAATTGSDTSNSESIVPSQAVVIQSNPDSLPTVGQAKWGLILFLAVGTNAGTATVTSSPSHVPADGSTTSTITVTLLDANSDPVVGNTVTLAQGGGSSVISAASGTSDSNGVVTFTVTNTTVETVTYTATDTTVSVTITQTANVVFFDPDFGTAGPSPGVVVIPAGEGGIGVSPPELVISVASFVTTNVIGSEESTINFIEAGAADADQKALEPDDEFNEVVVVSG